MELIRENSSFAEVRLELYQAGLEEEEVQVDIGSMSLNNVVGGLQGGLVYKVWSAAAAACAGLQMSMLVPALQTAQLAKVLILAVTRVMEEMEDIKQLVVDNITFPVKSPVANN